MLKAAPWPTAPANNELDSTNPSVPLKLADEAVVIVEVIPLLSFLASISFSFSQFQMSHDALSKFLCDDFSVDRLNFEEYYQEIRHDLLQRLISYLTTYFYIQQAHASRKQC